MRPCVQHTTSVSRTSSSSCAGVHRISGNRNSSNPSNRSLSLLQATVKMEDGKLVADFPNYRHTAEISGGKLVEVSAQTSRVVHKKQIKKTLKSSRLKILSLEKSLKWRTGSEPSPGLLPWGSGALIALFNQSFGVFFVPDFYFFWCSLQKDQQKDCLRQQGQSLLVHWKPTIK